MSERRVPGWIWPLLVLGTLGAWRPLLEDRVWAAAQHSSELLQPEEWSDLAAHLPEVSDDAPPLFVRAGNSAAFVWARFLAYPQRMAVLPRNLDADALRRVLPARSVWMLLLNAGDAAAVVWQLGARTTPRMPVARGQHAGHVLVELPP
ncbi:MAG: hypothetical protein DHS20C15_05300 [Planctomycetota bacterium]|nr:MAG: hypothetical protein DHS20C15_05300 [Planctomycetota bacterium]